MLRLTTALALVLAAGLTAACSDNDTPTAPDTETPVAVTETFTGTLTPNGGVTHSFVAQRAGDASVQVSALTPADARIGLSLGPLSGNGCSQSVANDAATANTQLVGRASTGNFCVRVYDASGQLAGPVDYQLSVTHF
jgi:hypothetical protein